MEQKKFSLSLSVNYCLSHQYVYYIIFTVYDVIFAVYFIFTLVDQISTVY